MFHGWIKWIVLEMQKNYPSILESETRKYGVQKPVSELDGAAYYRDRKKNRRFISWLLLVSLSPFY
jgi:hypothetical protein